MSEKLEKEIAQLASRVFKIPLSRLKGDADLFKDLGVDSMQAIEIVSALHKKYKLVVNLNEVVYLRTLNQIIEFVKKVMKKDQKSPE